MNLILICLGIYATLSFIMVVIVGSALFKNGKVFLFDIFRGDQELTEAVNKLLLIGFYLINVGFILLNYNYNLELHTWSELVQKVCGELGIIIFCLGAIHMLNIFLLLKMRKRNALNADSEIARPFSQIHTQKQALAHE